MIEVIECDWHKAYFLEKGVMLVGTECISSLAVNVIKQSFALAYLPACTTEIVVLVRSGAVTLPCLRGSHN